MNWGCTAYCTDFLPSPCSTGGTAGYPFSTATATVAIEGTAANNRYLRDVIPQETGPAAYHETAIRAQAIAARTYAYWFVQHPLGWPDYHINNSAQKQMFVPYKFDTLTTDQQTIVNNALPDRYYLSQAADDNPIFSEFFADIPLRTLDGGQPYLISVEDPISSHPDVSPDGHGHGMSQKGASRWARGNLGAYLGNDLGAWSVSWPDRYQILTHYYTGVHVRDANNGNALLTPPRRFVVLSVNGGPRTGRICRNRVSWLTLRLQNTGVAAWDAYTIALYACWGSQCSWAAWLPQAVTPGATYPPPGAPEWTVEIAPGSGALTLDLYGPGGWFSAQYPAWPRPTLALPVVSCRSLPYIAE
jgi:hypothetical protein